MKKNLKTRVRIILVSAAFLSFFAAGCGSSDSGSGSPSAGPTQGPASQLHGVNLQVDQADAASSIEFDSDTFSETDCEVVEGCVSAVGKRQLLKFNADIINAGDEDFILGDPATNPKFRYSPCHNHYHLQNIMLYELVDSSGHVVTAQSGSITVSRKQGFCLEDVQPYEGLANPLSPNSTPKYTCTNQGISAGWEDVYDSSLPCQWLDVTDVAPGNYTLRITVNPAGVYPDTNLNDNIATVPVTVPAAQ
jgi:hypothetical protein